MKWIILIVLFTGIEFVKANPSDSGCIKLLNGVPHYIVYILVVLSIVLFVMVVVLIIVLYKLKQKLYSESIGDDIKFLNVGSPTKYQHQVSIEKSDFNTDNGQDFCRLNRLHREGSKLIVFDGTAKLDNTICKSEEPSTSTYIPSRIKLPGIGNLQRDQMQKICEAVLSKTQRVSFTSLDKIANEYKKDRETNFTTIEKSTSSPLLDITVSNAAPFKKETETSNNILKKSDSASCNDVSIINNMKKETDELMTHCSNMHILPKSDNVVLDKDINKNNLNKENLSQVKNSVSHLESDDEDLEDLYDNPPSVNRPVLYTKDEEDHINDIYDNPPNRKRPVTLDSNEHLDGVYDNLPSDRPGLNFSPATLTGTGENFDSDYNNLQCIKFNNSSEKEVRKMGDDDAYDFPAATNQGIVFSHDNDTGYLIPINNDLKSYFNEDYINARSFNRNADTKIAEK